MKNKVKYLVLHHSAVEGNSQLIGVNKYHKDKWGMKSSLGYYVGYNYFYDKKNGRVQTRSHDEETVANKGHNCDIQERCDALSYCIGADYNKRPMTLEEDKAFRSWVHDMRLLYPYAKVVGHRDVQTGRTCPGSYITQDYLENVNLTETLSILENLYAQINILLARLGLI